MPRKRRSPASPGRLPWDALHPTLDLHGATGDEARARTERWLREQQASGVRTVCVITGRGRHSVGPPVLRGEIEALLGSLRASLVAGFELEARGGSFRVELRRPPPQRRAPPAPRSVQPPSVPADAELRRLAAEALAELGVQPTPELIEIELRRMHREGREG